MPSYTNSFAVILVLGIGLFDLFGLFFAKGAERLYSTSRPYSVSEANNEWPKPGDRSSSSNRRDWVNPSPRQQPTPIAQNQPSSPSQNEPKSQLGDQNSGGGRRDWVNPNPRASQISSTARPQAVVSPNTNNVWQNRANQNIPNNKRDWVNPNPLPIPVPSSTSKSQSDITVNPNNNAPKTWGNQSPQSNRRDFVNPSVTNSQTSTTPWPQLGQRPGQQPNQPQGPFTNPQIPKQNVNLADILKAPSHSPGWNIPVSSTIKTPSVGPGQPPQPSVSQSTPSRFSDQDLKDDGELKGFSEDLLKKDVNNAAKYVTINYQHKTSSRSTSDEAPQPLLTIKPEAYNLPTISKIIPLYNNYILETTESEYATPQEKSEENELIDAIISTPVMQHAKNFLIEKGVISKDPRDFREKLKQIWFNMYSRGGGRISSSGFEHVFLTEIKNREVSGLHNWLYFNDQETKNKANYLGYMKALDLGDKGAIIKHHFTFSNLDKPVGSMFIGTSPEFEMALYSTCFFLKPDKPCPLRLNGKDFIIRTYTYRYRGKNMIGSAFPEI